MILLEKLLLLNSWDFHLRCRRLSTGPKPLKSWKEIQPVVREQTSLWLNHNRPKYISECGLWTSKITVPLSTSARLGLLRKSRKKPWSSSRLFGRKLFNLPKVGVTSPALRSFCSTTIARFPLTFNPIWHILFSTGPCSNTAEFFKMTRHKLNSW